MYVVDTVADVVETVVCRVDVLDTDLDVLDTVVCRCSRYCCNVLDTVVDVVDPVIVIVTPTALSRPLISQNNFPPALTSPPVLFPCRKITSLQKTGNVIVHIRIGYS